LRRARELGPLSGRVEMQPAEARAVQMRELPRHVPALRFGGDGAHALLRDALEQEQEDLLVALPGGEELARQGTFHNDRESSAAEGRGASPEQGPPESPESPRIQWNERRKGPPRSPEAPCSSAPPTCVRATRSWPATAPPPRASSATTSARSTS